MLQFGAFVEVGIGLAIMYLMLGLMCTTLNELITSFLGYRSRDLRKAITQLIDNKDLYLSFYQHGIIRSELEMAAGKAVETPLPDNTKLQDAPAVQTNNQPPGEKDIPAVHSSYMDSKTFAWALIDSLDTSKPITTVAEALEIANKLPPSNVRDMLLNILNDADGNLLKARRNVANWFDGAMDRFSGQYKRSLQKVTLLIGFLLAAVLNADSFEVTKALWRNSTLRTEMVQQATDLASLTFDGIKDACKPNEPPATTPDSAAGSPAPASEATDTERKKIETCHLVEIQKRLGDLAPLPLGWTFGESFFAFLWTFVLKLPGILVTALAVSLGAPFWFDLLQKFVDFRGTGKKPNTLQEKEEQS